MTRIAVIGALVLFAAGCNKPAETPSAATDPAISAAPAPADTAPVSQTPLADAMSTFDPTRQRLVWVLPEGVHGAPPWEMGVKVKHRGEVQYEGAIPLNAEVTPGGSRPEFPAGAEVVRLSGDEHYGAEMAKVGKVIDDLIAQHGRGDGELEIFSELKTKIDPAFRNAYCVEGKRPAVFAFIEEGDPSQLRPLDLGPMDPFFEATILKDCAS